MKQIEVTASKEYTVEIGAGLLTGVHSGYLRWWLVNLSNDPVMIVSDDIVYDLYGETLRRSLDNSVRKVHTFVFPNGEQSKNLSTYGELMEALSENGFTRSSSIFALGGGVVGDLAGFAAATYQRGIKVYQVPTTLLAAVDSSVGGKTAVDLKSGKNQVGCFWQPSHVICDTNVFATLPEEQYRCGCA